MDKMFFEYLEPSKVFDADMNYKQFTNLTSDLVKGRINSEDVRAANDSIYKYVLRTFGLDGVDLHTPKSARMLNKAIRNHTPAFMELIEETVYSALASGFEKPFFTELVEISNVADGDAYEWTLEDDDHYLAVAKVAPDHHDITLQQIGAYETFTATPSRYAVGVGADIRAYLLGKVDFTGFIRKVYESFEKKLTDEIYAELTQIANKMPINSVFTLTTQFNSTTKTTIDTLIQDIDALNHNDGVVIMGTRVGLSYLEKLDDIDWRSSDAKNERYHNGRLGSYMGIDLVEIPQSVELQGANTVKRLIDDKTIYVFPKSMEKFIKLVNWGDPYVDSVNNIGDYQDDTMKFAYYQSFTVLSIVRQAIGVIKVTD